MTASRADHGHRTPPRDLRYDLSLRLWSAAAPLGPVAESLGLEVKVLHVAGEPMAASGPLASRIATRHFASLAHADVARAEDVDAWFAETLAKVQVTPALSEGLRSGAVEGTCWISAFGGAPAPSPTLDARGLATADALGLAVLIENYTDPESAPFPVQARFVGGPAV